MPTSENSPKVSVYPVRRAALAGGLFLLTVILAAACARGPMRRSQARDVLVTIPGMDLPKENVYVEKVSQLDSRQAVAEASIKTAFRMEKSGNEWVVAEVRLGQDRWLLIQDLYAGVERAQVARTRQSLNQLALGLERYRIVHGDYPEATDLMQLVDLIYPRHISSVEPLDAWSNPLVYQRPEPTQYRIVSLGPDGRLGTDDDIAVVSEP